MLSVWPNAFRDCLARLHQIAAIEGKRLKGNVLCLDIFLQKNVDMYQRMELTAKQAQLFAALGLEPPPKILGIHPRA